MRSSILAGLLLSVACRRGGGERAAPPPAGDAEVVAVPSAVSDLRAPADVAPTDGSDEAVGLVVIIARAVLKAGDEESGELAMVATLPASREDAARTGLDAKYKADASSYVIVPLDAAARRARASHPNLRDARVIAEPRTPYRVLVEVLTTLGHSYERFHFMVLQGAVGGDAGPRDAAPPSVSRRAPPRDPHPPPLALDAADLELRVEIADEGASFRTAQGALGAGCELGTAGVTIPSLGAAQDYEGMAWCARRLEGRAGASASDSQVTLAATGGTDYETVISVMDALRGDAKHALFTNVIFARPL